MQKKFLIEVLTINKGQIYLHPLFTPIIKTMDQKKLEKLSNIKNYLENDDIVGLNKYIERIRPTVNEDEDFTDIFEELKNKNYDQALFLTEEIIYETDSEEEYTQEFDKLDLDEFEQKDEFIFENPEENFEDFTEEQFDDDLTYYEDKDDDYF